MSKVSAKEVVQFFKEAELDVAELVLEFAQGTIQAKLETHRKRSDAMAKARAARKPKGAKAVATVPGTPAPQAGRRAAPGHVSAPAHTAAATSVASDNAIAS